MTMFGPSQPKDYEQMELTGLTSFVAAFPVNRFPLPGSSKARTITATSGRKCLGLYRRSDPLGSLVKMLLVSSVWHSARCLLIWKASGTKSNRLLFQLVPSMPLTEEIGSGSWPTPSASMVTMADMIQAQFAGNDPNRPTYAQAKMFATPNAADSKNSTLPPSQLDRDSVPGNLLQQGQTGTLSPLFVEWLMGYPSGWTDLKHSETL